VRPIFFSRGLDESLKIWPRTQRPIRRPGAQLIQVGKTASDGGFQHADCFGRIFFRGVPAFLRGQAFISLGQWNGPGQTFGGEDVFGCPVRVNWGNGACRLGNSPVVQEQQLNADQVVVMSQEQFREPFVLRVALSGCLLARNGPHQVGTSLKQQVLLVPGQDGAAQGISCRGLQEQLWPDQRFQFLTLSPPYQGLRIQGLSQIALIIGTSAGHGNSFQKAHGLAIVVRRLSKLAFGTQRLPQVDVQIGQGMLIVRDSW